ncbi:MAG: hypothetical protein GY749_23170 [Desulfobacteraceae bacterium]|nr:hypothetical protein [Desulfobacteraceae bacterium]
MEKVCSENFIKIFSEFENRLNSVFQKNTKLLQGGNVRNPKKAVWYQYKKKLVSKDDVAIEIKVLYDKENDDYIYYSYNILFGGNKMLFHYEPTHKEHFQPHINVYVEEKELKNLKGEGIHIVSHKYHPFEILALTERYFG